MLALDGELDEELVRTGADEDVGRLALAVRVLQPVLLLGQHVDHLDAAEEAARRVVARKGHLSADAAAPVKVLQLPDVVVGRRLDRRRDPQPARERGKKTTSTSSTTSSSRRGSPSAVRRVPGATFVPAEQKTNESFHFLSTKER